MPPPKKVSRYPVEYRRLGEVALAQGSITIPAEKPRSLRMYLQSYFRAMEREGDSTFADCLIVSCTETEVVVRLREQSMHTDEIARALGANNSPTPASDAERLAQELLDQIRKD